MSDSSDLMDCSLPGLFHPCDFPGSSTGVGYCLPLRRYILQGIFLALSKDYSSHRSKGKGRIFCWQCCHLYVGLEMTENINILRNLVPDTLVVEEKRLPMIKLEFQVS